MLAAELLRDDFSGAHVVAAASCGSARYRHDRRDGRLSNGPHTDFEARLAEGDPGAARRRGSWRARGRERSGEARAPMMARSAAVVGAHLGMDRAEPARPTAPAA
jgi:hypothetical protein